MSSVPFPFDVYSCIPTRMSVYDGPCPCWWIWLVCAVDGGHFTGHFRLDLCAEIGGEDCAPRLIIDVDGPYLVLSMATYEWPPSPCSLQEGSTVLAVREIKPSIYYYKYTNPIHYPSLDHGF